MSSVLVFILVLGVLIFVHEAGHFLAAKACGIYVDRFSLGMPPRLFGFKYGETDYCIGLLPIGGYVKMAGQEDVPQTDEVREQAYGHVPPEKWFNNKPRWQRAIVLFAGPAMNVVLGFVVFGTMAAVGSQVPLAQYDNRVGLIDEDSPAANAPLYRIPPGQDTVETSGDPDEVGWKTGDRIVRINETKVTRIEDVAYEGALSAGKTVLVFIERTEPDGSVVSYLSPVKPEVPEGAEFARFGIMPYQTALVAQVIPGSPAAENGFQEGDVIVRANGERVDSASFSRLVKDLPEDTQVSVEIRRDGDTIVKTLNTQTVGTVEGISFTPSLQPLLRINGDSNAVISLDAPSFVRETGLQKGDSIQQIDGEPVNAERIQSLMDADPARTVSVTAAREPLGFGVLREGKTFTAEVTVGELLRGLRGFEEGTHPSVALVTQEVAEKTQLQRRDQIVEIDGEPATVFRLNRIEETRIGETVPVKVNRPAIGFGLLQRQREFDSEISITKMQMIGVVWGTKTVFRREPPSQIAPHAWEETKRVFVQIYRVLTGLFTGSVGPQMLGGPVMIYQAATTAAQSSLHDLLSILAIISINLAVFNLLPLPVLDGGQLLFLGIEAVRRKPVDVRVMELVQQVGILFILALIVYVTFNDVSRLVDNLLP